MKLAGAHLTYCTNIHPGESWPEIEANLRGHVVAVKAKVSPDAPFGVGLRMSGRAARELADGALPRLQRVLADHDLYVFTINGFPYGTFHGAPVKAAVYRPDWREAERLAYTNLLADLLAELLPAGVDGSISTVPGCFRERAAPDADAALAEIAAHLRSAGAYCAAIERARGKKITIAIEPEPCCVIETLDEAIALFTRHLRGASHLGLCLDACHAAVEFEDLPAAIAAVRAAEVPIAKLQLSAGLRVAPVTPAQRAALVRFSDDVYLHQVVARRGDRLTRYTDLPAALGDPAPSDEWRVHFHVPIVKRDLGAFASTQDFLADLLALQRRAPLSSHLEVETYTWDVLPPELRDVPVTDAIAGELRWVRDRLLGEARA
ncbi:MAG TPA: metabolite traffic protein EboE [Kofleriaceae bacterium]|nr:metabolite traffic protein EboE [Kofleriaceae bacterium]